MRSDELILVVDDLATQRTKMTMAVRELGHLVDAASDGNEALQKLRSKKYDLILLEL